MTEDEIKDKMEDYLLGKLSLEEASAFESELAGNLEWQEEFDLRRLEHEGMDLLLEHKLREDMRRWDSEPKAPNSKSSFWPLWIIGLLILGTGFFFWIKKIPSMVPFSPQHTLPDSTKAQTPAVDSPSSGKKDSSPFAQLPPKPGTHPSPTAFAQNSVGDLDVGLGVRGDDSEAVLDLSDSLNSALTAKDYTHLLRLTERKLPAHAATLLYIRGWTYFKLGHFSEAENTFLQLITENNPRLITKSQRLLMYSLLAQWPKKKTTLIEILNQINAIPQHPLQQETQLVERLLAQLQKNVN